MNACMVLQIAAFSKPMGKSAYANEINEIKAASSQPNLRKWATVVPEPGAKNFFEHVFIHILQPC